MLRNQARGNLISQWLHQIDYHYDISNQLDTVRFSSWAAVDTFIVFGYNTSGERISKNYIRNWKDSCGGVQQGMMGPLGGGATSGSGGGGVPGDPDRGRLCDYMDTTLTWYVRGKGKVLAEYTDSSSTPNFKYIYAGDQRIAMYDFQGNLYFFLNDHLGSARVVLDDDSAVVQDKYSYYPFGGMRTATTSTNQAYKYTGKPFDDESNLDLYYYGVRYSDPEHGRFTQIDPLAMKYPGWSPYVYALNNPIKNIDPDGRVAGEADPTVQEI